MEPADDSFAWPALLSLPLAALLLLAALGGIVLPGVYSRETALWAAQGVGQDWVDLVVVAPALVVTALGSLRGSRLFRLLLGGVLVYSAYSFVLYAFAMHFNSLFLLYAFGLGLSFYAIVALVAALHRENTASWFSERAPVRLAGGFAALLGVMFYVLWLAEIVPSLINRSMPKSAQEAGLITNPVHVLDVGIVLPAFILGGLALWRRRPLGFWLTAMMLAFAVVMDLALMGMVVSMAARKLSDGGPPLPVFAVMTLVTAIVLWALLRELRPAGADQRRHAEDGGR
jgi:hypothetical protein